MTAKCIKRMKHSTQGSGSQNKKQRQQRNFKAFDFQKDLL